MNSREKWRLGGCARCHGDMFSRLPRVWSCLTCGALIDLTDEDAAYEDLLVKLGLEAPTGPTQYPAQERKNLRAKRPSAAGHSLTRIEPEDRQKPPMSPLGTSVY